MGWLGFVVLAWLAASIDVTLGAHIRLAPLCWLAVASWAMLGSDRGFRWSLWWRLWWVGLCADAFSPLGGIWSTSYVLCMGAIIVGVRQVLSPRSPITWFVVAMLLHVGWALLMGGLSLGLSAYTVAESLLTALAAVVMTVSFLPLSERWHPLAHRY